MVRISAENDVRLAEGLGDYWNGRARSYSNGVIGELGDERKSLWTAALEEASRGADEDAWRRVWTENEQLYYGSTPAFSLEAV